MLLTALCWGQDEGGEGKALFRSNCAFCHGLTGGGGRGPSLAATRLDAAALKAVVRNGVPGTNMPSFESMTEPELDELARYVRQLGAGQAPSGPVPGDPAHGRSVYENNGCAGCHRIGSEGSVYGPELTRIGAARPAAYLRESLVNPTADIAPEYEGVTVETRDGASVTGVRVNEDNFTVQLRDPVQQFRMFRKDEVAAVVHQSKSLMPPYAALPARDLQDLLAYLSTLRGQPQPGTRVPEALVTPERLVKALSEPHNWLTYWGDYTGVRHRPLDQINISNVKDLRAEWIFQTGAPGAFETVPLVVDGIMYLTTGDGGAYALDARTGRQLWQYRHAFPPGRKAQRVNRGFAILGDRLFMVTGDANLVALELLTGRPAWQTEIVPIKPAPTTPRSRRWP